MIEFSSKEVISQRKIVKNLRLCQATFLVIDMPNTSDPSLSFLMRRLFGLILKASDFSLDFLQF